MKRSKSTTKVSKPAAKPAATKAQLKKSPSQASTGVTKTKAAKQDASPELEKRRSRSSQQSQQQQRMAAKKEPRQVAAATAQQTMPASKSKSPAKKVTTAAVKRSTPSQEEKKDVTSSKRPVKKSVSPPKATKSPADKDVKKAAPSTQNTKKKVATAVKDEPRSSSSKPLKKERSTSRQASQQRQAPQPQNPPQPKKGKKAPAPAPAPEPEPTMLTTQIETTTQPKVEIKVRDLAQKEANVKTEEVPQPTTNQEVEDLPIKSEVTSRVKIEQEIERLFGGSSSFGLNVDNGGVGIAADGGDDCSMRDESAFQSQQAQLKREKNMRYQELKRKFETASKQIKFTPTFPHGMGKGGKPQESVLKKHSGHPNHLVSLDQIAKMEDMDVDQKSKMQQAQANAAMEELKNLPQQDRVMRKTPSMDAKGKLDAAKRAKPAFALSGAAFGAPSAGAIGPAGTHQDHKEAKKKQAKILMNEQNGRLAQDPDRYVPNELPFFKPNTRGGVEAENGGQAEQEGLIKLKKTASHASGAPAAGAVNPGETEFGTEAESEVDSELKDMLYDSATGKLACSNYEALLLQLPGTLPYADIKPHTATALEEMIDRLSEKSLATAKQQAEDIEMQSQNGDLSNDSNQQAPAPKIGKLRIHKSGKVVMRIQLPGEKQYVDLELNQGIQTNFYQELVAVDSETQNIHFLAPVQHKLVATPDLDSILASQSL